MFTQEDAQLSVGIVGNIIALILLLSPAPTFVKICKNRTVAQYSAVPYLATFVNCGLWVLYGLPLVNPHSTLVMTINGTGFAIEIVYLSLFIVFSDSKNRLKLALIAIAECLFVVVLAVLVLTLAHSTKLRSYIIGSVCMVGNIIMYASPLSVMKIVVATKSVEYMPFFPSLFSFLNGACWTAYALIRFDLFIAVPNGIGAVLGLGQLVLYANFYKPIKVPKEMGLAQVAAKDGPNKNEHASDLSVV